MPKSPRRAAKPARSPARRRAAKPQKRGLQISRGSMVGVALVLALGLTAATLAILSPPPLQPDVSGRLFAAGDAPRSIDFEPAFETRAPIEPGRWRAIYVHHSNTLEGSAATLAEQARLRGASGPADHFIIGNGRGMADGEVQFTPRWSDQAGAAPPEVGIRIDSRWVSICLIGDFDRNPPTAAQRKRLSELIAALGQRLHLGEKDVVRLNHADSAAGAGALFLSGN